jgi:hypothetical protein
MLIDTGVARMGVCVAFEISLLNLSPRWLDWEPFADSQARL